jgi:hypothetical protein
MQHVRYWLIGLLLTGAGCGTANQPETTPAPEANSGEFPVQVDNQNFNDMNIYLVNGGQRWLLGQAGGLTRTTLRIPQGMTPGDGRVRFEADPIGASPPIFTPELVVSPGQSVYWTIGSDPEMSSASTG